MVPILMYHQLARPRRRGAYLRCAMVQPQRFANQMLLLKRLGYQGVSLQQGLPYIRCEKKGKVVVITFDDGYQNVFQYARPILNELGFTATNFIVADLMGGINEWMLAKGSLVSPLMTAAQIQQWAAVGHEVGSHTLSHVYLSQEPPKEQSRQLAQSKVQLEDLLGHSVVSFCYPFGDLDAAAIEAVKVAGYACAVGTHKGLARQEDNLYALPRVSIIRSNHLLRFYQKALTQLEHKRRKVYW